MAYDATIDNASISISLNGSMYRTLADAQQGSAQVSVADLSIQNVVNFTGSAQGSDPTTATLNTQNAANFVEVLKVVVTGSETVNINLYDYTVGATGSNATITGSNSYRAVTGSEDFLAPTGQTVTTLTALKGLVVKNTSTAAQDSAIISITATTAIPDLFGAIGDIIKVLPGGCLALTANRLEDATGADGINGITIANSADEISFAFGGAGSAEIGLIGFVSS